MYAMDFVCCLKKKKKEQVKSEKLFVLHVSYLTCLMKTPLRKNKNKIIIIKILLRYD